MSERDDLPDTAMATGNDEGEPGQPDTRPLAPDERQLLEALDQPADGPAADDVRDAVPAPPDGPGEQDDGLTPEFTDR
jgi:hypothetical protein